ncbi:hypothetical protein D9M70_559910 [compost metagenome]
MIAPGKRHAFDEMLPLELRDIHRNRRFLALTMRPEPLFVSTRKNSLEFVRFLFERPFADQKPSHIASPPPSKGRPVRLGHGVARVCRADYIKYDSIK